MEFKRKTTGWGSCESPQLPMDGKWGRGRESVMLFAMAVSRQPQGEEREFREDAGQPREPGKAPWALGQCLKEREIDKKKKTGQVTAGGF